MTKKEYELRIEAIRLWAEYDPYNFMDERELDETEDDTIERLAMLGGLADIKNSLIEDVIEGFEDDDDDEIKQWKKTASRIVDRIERLTA